MAFTYCPYETSKVEPYEFFLECRLGILIRYGFSGEVLLQNQVGELGT